MVSDPAVVAKERALYRDVWQGVEQYGTYAPGATYVDLFREMAQAQPGWHVGSVLDAGCGSGKGAVALQAAGFRVTLCDLTDDGLVPEARSLPFKDVCLWHDLRPLGWFDYVYCCDVLEHIPPPFTMLVIDRLLTIARRSVFLSISLVPDQFGVWVGESLHKTVQPFTTWRDQLATIGTVVEARDLLNTGVFLMRPR